MDALFAPQSLLHCLAVFGSAIADCDQASSPTNAAHKAAATFGLITHPSGKTPRTLMGQRQRQRTAALRGCKLGAQPGPAALECSLFVLALSRQIVNTL